MMSRPACRGHTWLLFYLVANEQFLLEKICTSKGDLFRVLEEFLPKKIVQTPFGCFSDFNFQGLCQNIFLYNYL